jgi:hypothetical protein
MQGSPSISTMRNDKIGILIDVFIVADLGKCSAAWREKTLAANLASG